MDLKTESDHQEKRNANVNIVYGIR